MKPPPDRSFPKPRMQRGVTLIELLIGMVVLLVLVKIGLPPLRDLINDTKVSTSVNEFIAATGLARAEAVRRGRLVTICASGNATGAAPSCLTSGTNWAGGWLVYVEGSSASGVGTYEAPASSAPTGTEDPSILLRQGALSVNANSSARTLTFNPSGMPVGTAAAFTGFNFSADGKSPRKLCVGRSGRVDVIVGGTDATIC
jgi:type IV fimbrial biogenesis protein FimT